MSADAALSRSSGVREPSRRHDRTFLSGPSGETLERFGVLDSRGGAPPDTGFSVASRRHGGRVKVGRAARSSRSDTTPFGGVGASGTGKRGGIAGVREVRVEVPYEPYEPYEPYPATVSA